MSSVYPLFSYPVMVCSETYGFTDAEIRFIDSLAMAENVGNAMSEDDHLLERQELADLRAFIEAQIAIYRKQVLRMKDDNEIYITQSWANKARRGDFHPKHKHPNSLLSGVLFVTGDEQEPLPPIRFHRTNDLFPLELDYAEFNEFNTGSRWFNPVPGGLILFPSTLEHDVDRNETDRERITLSFNTFIRGPIGNKRQLTEVTRPGT